MKPEHLEKLLKGDEFLILDTCFTDISTWENKEVGLHDALFEGLGGLHKLTPDFFEETLERNSQIAELAYNPLLKNRLVIIREVADEIKAGVAYVERGLRFLENKKEIEDVHFEIIKKLRQNNFEKSKFLRKLSKHEFKLAFKNAPKDYLKTLNSLLDNHEQEFLHFLNPTFLQEWWGYLVEERPELYASREIRGSDFCGVHQIDFANYAHFLERTLAESKESKRAALEKACCRKKPGGHGLFLDTDSKVIATAFALAYDRGVKILSSDYGIKRILYKIQDEGKLQNGNSYPLPPHPIDFVSHLDLDQKVEHHYDLMVLPASNFLTG